MEQIVFLNYEVERSLIWIRCRDYSTLSSRSSFLSSFNKFPSSFKIIDGIVHQRACIIRISSSSGSFLCMLPDYVSWYRPLIEGRNIVMGSSFSPKFSVSFGLRSMPFFALADVNMSRLSESGVRLHRGWYPYESNGCLLHIAGIKGNDDQLHSYSVIVSSEDSNADIKDYARDSVAANKMLLSLMSNSPQVEVHNAAAQSRAIANKELVADTTPSNSERAMYIIQRKY